MNESRRDLLKKAGVGAGIVWAAPILQTLRTPAAAAGSPTPGSSTTSIPSETCGLPSTCGGDINFCDTQTLCVCGTTTEGTVGCGELIILQPCESDATCPGGTTCEPLTVDPFGSFCVTTCTSSADCGPGAACAVDTCFDDGICIPICSAEDERRAVSEGVTAFGVVARG
jgi:hypothetical protein